MIVGIGVDVVDIARFERGLIRTPALKDRQVKPANSYSKIYEESKEDDSLMSLTRDLEDAGDESHQQPATSDEEVPD